MYEFAASSPRNRTKRRLQTAKGDTYQASQVKRSAPALCLLRSCLRRNVAPLESEPASVSTSYSAARGRVRRNHVPPNSTIRLDTLTCIWVVANVHSGVLFGTVGTDAHFSTSGETASRLSAKADGFRKGCEVMSGYSFILSRCSLVLRATLSTIAGKGG